MDFSSDIFRPPQPDPNLSADTMDHARMVMACRFGWTASPGPHTQNPSGTFLTQPTASQPSFSNPPRSSKTNRFTPCRGRLYHQLTCSHRIRTDLVEECGPNCLEPLVATSHPPFYCHECIEQESCRIWAERETQLKSMYPEMAQMTQEQYERWYSEYRQLEAQHTMDRAKYEMELKSTTRPSNVCSAVEMSLEEKEFAAELDSLSLSMASATDMSSGLHPTRPHRISLPGDASEQLHWGLNSLALERGSCGIEYATNQNNNGSHNASRILDEETLWRKPRDRN